MIELRKTGILKRRPEFDTADMTFIVNIVDENQSRGDYCDRDFLSNLWTIKQKETTIFNNILL